jgi:hypothetical protein
MRSLLALTFTAALATTAVAQDIGVPECDSMLKTYETCVMTKAPDASKAQMKTTFETMRTNWKSVAATADGKKQLASVCAQTKAQMQQQLASFKCAW